MICERRGVVSHSSADEVLGSDSLLELAVEDLDLRVDGDHLELRLVAKASGAGLGPTDDAHANNLDEELLGGKLHGLHAAAALATAEAEAAAPHDVRGEVILHCAREAAALALGLCAGRPDGAKTLRKTRGSQTDQSKDCLRGHSVGRSLVRTHAPCVSNLDAVR